MTASAFSPALAGWARAQGQHLADAFLHDDIEERGDAAALIDHACGQNRLLAALREHAETAFPERIAEMKAALP